MTGALRWTDFLDCESPTFESAVLIFPTIDFEITSDLITVSAMSAKGEEHTYWISPSAVLVSSFPSSNKPVPGLQTHLKHLPMHLCSVFFDGPSTLALPSPSYTAGLCHPLSLGQSLVLLRIDHLLRIVRL